MAETAAWTAAANVRIAPSDWDQVAWAALRRVVEGRRRSAVTPAEQQAAEAQARAMDEWLVEQAAARLRRARAPGRPASIPLP